MGHQSNYTTTALKRKHLTYEQRQKIEAHLSDGLNAAQIAEKFGVHRTTIEREIKLGTVIIDHWAYKEKRAVYAVEVAQKERDYRSSGKGRGLKIGNNHAFVKRVEALIQEGYSPYAALQHMRNEKEDYGMDVCTKTIYNYIDSGDVFTNITNKDLLFKCRSKKQNYQKIKRVSEKNKKGTSINERPESIDSREEIGHWEIDLVVGKQGTKPVILTLIERKTRKSLYVLLKNKTQTEVLQALKRLQRRVGGDFSEVFKSITADNGSEFLDFEGMKNAVKCGEIYYAHPYSSWERGSSENGNRFLRRFLPKGTDFTQLNEKDLRRYEDWINNYPRAILGGKSANMLWICGKAA